MNGCRNTPLDRTSRSLGPGTIGTADVRITFVNRPKDRPLHSKLYSGTPNNTTLVTRRTALGKTQHKLIWQFGDVRIHDARAAFGHIFDNARLRDVARQNERSINQASPVFLALIVVRHRGCPGNISYTGFREP
jgi:hypothetical protein